MICNTKTALPENSSQIYPHDIETLRRYGVRVKNGSGFVFINNYQDHLKAKNQEDFGIKLKLKNGELRITKDGSLFLNKDSYSILPFNFQLKGINLNYSTTQLITKLNYNNEEYYFSLERNGATGEYSFKEDSLTFIDVENGRFEKHDGSIIAKVTDGTISKIQLS